MSRNFPSLRPIEASLVTSNLGRRPDTAAVHAQVARTVNGAGDATPIIADNGGERLPDLRQMEASVRGANGAVDTASVHDAVVATLDAPAEQDGPDVPALLADVAARIDDWHTACRNGTGGGTNHAAHRAHMDISNAVAQALHAGVPEETLEQTVTELTSHQSWSLIRDAARRIAARLATEA